MAFRYSARAALGCARIHLLLAVHAEGGTVTFRDSSGQSFSCYDCVA
jgi:hypothetical protein